MDAPAFTFFAILGDNTPGKQEKEVIKSDSTLENRCSKKGSRENWGR